MGFIEAMNKYIPSKYLNVPKLLLIDRFEYETREESELRTVQELMRYKLLFLDDMGAETVTGRTRELLYLILNNAIENGSQRLFITSNKPLSYFVEHVDDRIASRIAGLCGKDNVLKLVDQDRRLA
jgi:DNA replication protein DnaC